MVNRLTARGHLPCHRVLPTLSNATYDKRIEKVLNINSCKNWGLVLKSFAIKSHLLLIFVIFLTRGLQLELVVAFEGVGIPLVIEQALVQVAQPYFALS